jgi:hypothetical protein
VMISLSIMASKSTSKDILNRTQEMIYTTEVTNVERQPQDDLCRVLRPLWVESRNKAYRFHNRGGEECLNAKQAEILPVLTGQIARPALHASGKRGLTVQTFQIMILLCLHDRTSLLFVPRPFTNNTRHYVNEPQFEVEGVLISRTDVKNITPQERTISHWRILVDWDLQYQRPFVVIDPFDPQGMLYLTSHEYTVHTRTLARAGISITVVARPGTDKPVPVKSPPEFLCECLDAVSCLDYEEFTSRPYKGTYRTQTWRSESDLASDFSRIPWNEFTDLRKYISRNVLWGEGQTVKVTHENVMAILMLWSRELLHYLAFKSPGSRIGQLMSFIQHLQTLLRHNGPAFTIQRMKISLFCLYSYVGGNPIKSTEGLGQRVKLSGGLPTFIDARLRSSIRDGVPSTIRLWASLLNSYKAFFGPHGTSPLETIQAPAFNGPVGDFASFCQGIDSFYSRLQDTVGKPLPAWKYKSAVGLIISSAGANASSAMAGLRFDLLAWKHASRHLPREWFELWGDRRMLQLINLLTIEAEEYYSTRDEVSNIIPQPIVREGKSVSLPGKLWSLIRRVEVMDEDGDLQPWRISETQLEDLRKLIFDCYKTAKVGSPTRTRAERLLSNHPDSIPGWQLEDWIESWRKIGLYPGKMVFESPIVGRLHSIPEPAGKVRVVAIGDYYSQVALKPLHEYIFTLLRQIPTDATFGQQEAVDTFAARGFEEIYSFDLKAATDLIPSQLYVEALEPLIGRKGADLWHSLMKDRKWLAPKDIRKDGGPTFVNYTRGQPMGLLSSWAALALVHHVIVQFAAKQAGKEAWFTDYLVLGDDIVIADKLVADAYLTVCDSFGIQVGLAKSLVSKWFTNLVNPG